MSYIVDIGVVVSLFSRYYSRAVAVVILYDITKHTSFQDVSQRWLRELNESENLQDPVLLLVGHKHDLRHLRTVAKIDGEELAGDKSYIVLAQLTHIYLVWV